MIKSGHEKLFTTNQHLSAKCSRDCSHLATEQPNTDTHMASINLVYTIVFLVVLFITEFFSLVLFKKQ